MPTGDAPRDLRDLRDGGKLLRLIIVVSMAVTALWLLVGGLTGDVQAQSQSDSSQSPDHYYYQFYGYARDIPIDGEALQPGDSIAFESTRPHRIMNEGRGRARAVWVNLSPRLQQVDAGGDGNRSD